MSGFRYWAPVAMMIVRAWTHGPPPIVDAIGAARRTRAAPPSARRRAPRRTSPPARGRCSRGAAPRSPSGSRGSSRCASSSPPARPARWSPRRGRRGPRTPRRPRPRDPAGPAPITTRSRRTSSFTWFKPEALAHFVGGRLLEDALASADEDRDVVDAHAEGVEGRLHAGVHVHVDVGVRLVVAGQELLDRQRPGGVPRADQDDVPESPRHQRAAAKHERAEEDLAQLRVGLDEPPEVIRGPARERA